MSEEFQDIKVLEFGKKEKKEKKEKKAADKRTLPSI